MMNGVKVDGSAGGKRKKKRQLKPSEMLEMEAKRKEEQLNELRKVMQQERQLKMKNQSSNGTHWRSATNKKKLFGYSDMVLDQYSSKESTTDGSNLPSAQSNRSKVSKTSKNKENVTMMGLQLQKAPKMPMTNNIVTNFHKAITDQNSDFNEVESFLSEIKMEKYKETFIENGIEDKDTILELNESHLQELGLPLGHKLKIFKRIKEVRKQMGHTTQAQVQSTKSSASSQASASAQAEPQKSSTGTVDATYGASLLDGEYNEEENKAEFQAALDAWRGTGKPAASSTKNKLSELDYLKKTSKKVLSDTKSLVDKTKSKKSVRFAQDPPEEVLILNDDDDEEVEDNASAVIKSGRGPTTEIKEGMIAFKGLQMSANSFLFSEEASGSALWNVDLMSTVDHAGTSPRSSEIEQPPSVEPEDKEI
jgi:hypothetical protein